MRSPRRGRPRKRPLGNPDPFLDDIGDEVTADPIAELVPDGDLAAEVREMQIAAGSRTFADRRRM